MTSIIAFPALAIPMRSASTSQALNLIKNLAPSVDLAVQMRKSNTPQSPIDSNIEDLV
jgi:hypothetical protein